MNPSKGRITNGNSIRQEEPTQASYCVENKLSDMSMLDTILERLQVAGERMQRINDSHNINNRQFENILETTIGCLHNTDLNEALRDNSLDVKINTKFDALDNFLNRIYTSMTDAEELNYKTNQLLSTLKTVL